VTFNAEIVVTNPNLGQACTTAHLIYLRNYRCVSSLFYNNFINGMKWEPMEYKDIDWGNKLIFSHLADPIERRHKGIAHWLIRNNLHTEFRVNEEFQDYIINLPYIDNHSASYHEMLGEKITKIRWIICDYDNYDKTIENTDKFLQSQKILGWTNFDWRFKNIAGVDQRSLTREIKQRFTENKNNTHILDYFRKDIELFENLRKETQ